MNWSKKIRGIAKQAIAANDSTIYTNFINDEADKRKARRKREKINRRRNRKK